MQCWLDRLQGQEALDALGIGRMAAENSPIPGFAVGEEVP